MLSKMIYGGVCNKTSSLVFSQSRMISSKAQKRASTNDVQLRGTFLKGRQPDLPTMIWIPELMEPA